MSRIQLPERLLTILSAANELANNHHIFFRIEESRFYDEVKKRRLVQEQLNQGGLTLVQRQEILNKINEEAYCHFYQIRRTYQAPFLFWSVGISDVVFTGSEEAVLLWFRSWSLVAMSKYEALLTWQKWCEESGNSDLAQYKRQIRWIRPWNMFDG